jgi:hypothetical protein
MISYEGYMKFKNSFYVEKILHRLSVGNKMNFMQNSQVKVMSLKVMQQKCKLLLWSF